MEYEKEKENKKGLGNGSQVWEENGGRENKGVSWLIYYHSCTYTKRGFMRVQVPMYLLMRAIFLGIQLHIPTWRLEVKEL